MNKSEILNVIWPIVMSFLGWVTSSAQAKIKGFFNSLEDRKKEIENLQKELGKQEMVNQALWRNIDEMKKILHNAGFRSE